MINEIFNGSHQSPIHGYYEWWYFHFITDENISINVVLHETDIFGLNQVPYVSLSLLSQEGISRYYRCQLEKNEIARFQDFLNLANGFFSETEQSVNFSLVFDELKFSGQITKLSQPLIIQNGLLFEDRLNGLRSYWVPQIPYAKFNGVLQISDSVQLVRGMAYQDHQWGNIQIQNFVSDWAWGHFSSENRVIIFYRILTRANTIVDRLALVDGQTAIVNNSFATNHLEMLISQKEFENLSTNSELHLPNNSTSLFFAIKPVNQLRRRINEKYLGFRATYLRWSTEAHFPNGELETDMRGMTEYLRIRKYS